MLRIGITGGIGSGKSTVAHIFNVLGIPVYDADAAAKRLVAQNEDLKQKIINAFGKEAYTDGILNRKYLSSKVFTDPEKIKLLNSLVHPATIQDADEWMREQDSPYVVKEAALIFESGSHKHLDHVIGVSSPEELRIQRTMLRSNLSRGEVLSRMKQQMDEEKKMALCDFIIINDEEQMVIPQVLALHERLIIEEKNNGR